MQYNGQSLNPQQPPLLIAYLHDPDTSTDDSSSESSCVLSANLSLGSIPQIHSATVPDKLDHSIEESDNEEVFHFNDDVLESSPTTSSIAASPKGSREDMSD